MTDSKFLPVKRHVQIINNTAKGNGVPGQFFSFCPTTQSNFYNYILNIINHLMSISKTFPVFLGIFIFVKKYIYKGKDTYKVAI